MDSHEVLCTEYTRCFETVAPELDISVLSSPLRSPYQKWRQSPFAVINFSSRRYHRSQTPNVLRRRWTVARGYKPAARYHFHMLH